MILTEDGVTSTGTKVYSFSRLIGSTLTHETRMMTDPEYLGSAMGDRAALDDSRTATLDLAHASPSFGYAYATVQRHAEAVTPEAIDAFMRGYRDAYEAVYFSADET